MITYWHNPRCSKSRAGLALLQERGDAFVVRKYLDDAPSATELRNLHGLLGGDVFEMMRPCEPCFKALGLTPDSAPETLIAAMAANPILIERPIAMTGTKAVIGRPPEALLSLI